LVTQHIGDDKANQYFLRGFNLPARNADPRQRCPSPSGRDSGHESGGFAVDLRVCQ